MSSIHWPEDILDRMVRAVDRVRERLHRAAAALEESKIPYAVIDDNAVAAWVARLMNPRCAIPRTLTS